MNTDDRRKITVAMEQMSSQALRVLALAYREYASSDFENKGAIGSEKLSENNLVFVGMAGMIDPPRPQVRNAVNEFLAAGVKTVMIPPWLLPDPLELPGHEENV